MAEALEVMSIVSAIVQLADFGAKIIERLDEFVSNVHEVPQTFLDLKVQLPLLRDTLTKMKAKAEARLIDADTQRAVLNVVKGCQLQVQRLNEILIKTLSTPADSPWGRGAEDFHSIGQEGDIQQIIDQIQRYQISLVAYSTTVHSLSLAARAKPLLPSPLHKTHDSRADKMN